MSGVFKETVTVNTPTRNFHRTFTIVPNGSGGFSIVNDMLFITNTTRQQVRFFNSLCVRQLLLRLDVSVLLSVLGLQGALKVYR